LKLALLRPIGFVLIHLRADEREIVRRAAGGFVLAVQIQVRADRRITVDGLIRLAFGARALLASLARVRGAAFG
jgi:hypothetical protein